MSTLATRSPIDRTRSEKLEVGARCRLRERRAAPDQSASGPPLRSSNDATIVTQRSVVKTMMTMTPRGYREPAGRPRRSTETG